MIYLKIMIEEKRIIRKSIVERKNISGYGMFYSSLSHTFLLNA